MLKEKEALEATVKALGANASRGCSPQPKGAGLHVQKQQTEGVAGIKDGETDQSVEPSSVNQVIVCVCVFVCRAGVLYGCVCV